MGLVNVKIPARASTHFQHLWGEQRVHMACYLLVADYVPYGSEHWMERWSGPRWSSKQNAEWRGSRVRAH